MAKLQRAVNVLSLRLSVAFLWAATAACSGCAWTTTWLATEPVAHVPSDSIPVPQTVSGLLTPRCVKAAKVKFTDKPDKDKGTDGKEKKCLYMSVDVGNLLGATPSKEQRNAAVDVLLSVSDMNCSTFINRAFANREGLDYTKTWLQDLATAASAGTATVLAPAAAGFSGANLLIGKGIDTFDSTYYAQQTFQAMQTAIAGARTDIRTKINSSITQEPDKYTVRQALSDVIEYDDACSLRGGLAKLNAAAQRAQTQNETLATQVSQSSADEKEKTYRAGKIALQSGIPSAAVKSALE